MAGPKASSKQKQSKHSLKHSLEPEEEKAVTHLSQLRFHQSFILGANPDNGRLNPMRVTYSDSDYRESPGKEDGPTVLLIPGMYGGRYLGCGAQDALARRHKIRLVVPDKFGSGGTGIVPLEFRVKGFIDLVSALFVHLNIKHVALISHSAGTIYMFNVLIQLRQYLHPRHPYACFLAPFVHTSHTSSLAALSLVPDSVIGKSNRIIKFGTKNIAPVLGPVIGFSSGLHSAISQRTATAGISPEPNDVEVSDMDYSPTAKDIGGKAYMNTVMKYIFEEESSGGAEEALLCLKRGNNPSWGLINDYDEAVVKILSAEGALAPRDSSEPATEGPAANKNGKGETKDGKDSGDMVKPHDQAGKLRVQVFFAESDLFSGDKGKAWFDGVWRQNRSLAGSVIYGSETVEGTDHDSIADIKFGVINRVLSTIRETWV